MPAAVLMAIQGVMALVQAAPQITSIATSAKTFFSGLTSAGLITVEQENALHAKVDAETALFKVGIVPPPEFQVQPDPK